MQLLGPFNSYSRKTSSFVVKDLYRATKTTHLEIGLLKQHNVAGTPQHPSGSVEAVLQVVTVVERTAEAMITPCLS